MKAIILTNTYYQLIFAIQLKITLLKDQEVDIIISDVSNGADAICSILAKEALFRNCYYVKSKYLISGSKVQKMKSVRSAVFGCHLFDFVNDQYDALFAYNLDMATYALFHRMTKIKHDIVFHRFEEGILSYVDWKPLLRNRIVSIAEKVLQRKDPAASTDSFYCFYPQLYKGSGRPVKVPDISRNSDIIEILKRVFGINESELNYKSKYIFFSSVLDFEGGKSVGEFELAKKIADLVGKENILIKTHPRDRRNVYKEYGFAIDPHSSVPWEVIQLCGDFSGYIFLSVASSSVLAGSFMSDAPVKTYYLYMLCDVTGNEQAMGSARNIQTLMSDQGIAERLHNVRIAERLEEILDEG